MTSRAAKEWAASEVVTASNLNKPAGGAIGWSANSSDQTGLSSSADLTDVSQEVTVNTSRIVGVFVQGRVGISSAAADYVGHIQRDASNIGTWALRVGGANSTAQWESGFAWDTPSAGSHTYSATIARSNGSGLLDVSGTTPSNAKILIIDLGAAS